MIRYTFGLIRAHKDAAIGLIWKDDRTFQLQGTFVGVSTDVRKVPGMKELSIPEPLWGRHPSW